MKYNTSFQPKARILLQLGDQLIKNANIAVLELIKNSYDADATRVILTMNKIYDKSLGEIIIEDDGLGMDKDIIDKIWMFPGTDNKAKLIIKKQKSPKFGRLPIGEKGIGRFGVHKLGKEVEVITRKENCDEIYFKIDWDDFEKDAPLSTINIHIEERYPNYFINSTGTRIKISNLQKNWKRGDFRELYRAVYSLNSPFENKSSFKVLTRTDRTDWEDDLLKFKDIEDYALFFSDATIKGNFISELNYEFRPWDTMPKLTGRKLSLKQIPMVKVVTVENTKKKEQVDINLNGFGIGEIKFKILIFDLDSKILSLKNIGKKGLNTYLRANGGIRIFRDGIRVYDYGESDNDWLNLDIKRINNPGINISNNLILAAIDLKRGESEGLEEKTNREGFIENDSFFVFKDAITFLLSKINLQRNIDKLKIREYYGTPTVSEPVIGKLKILQDKIEKKVQNVALKEELKKIIVEIQKDYDLVNETYIRSSNAGINLGIVIHELEKLVDELIRMVEKYPKQSQIRILVNHLSRMINSYALVIKQSPKKNENVYDIIEQSLFNITFRLKAHKIEVIKRYITKKNFNINCSFNLIVSTIMNIFDNSIWWLHYGKVKHKRILIDIIEIYDNYISIIIADNGPGFSISPEYAIKPFITDKPGGTGLGLHLAFEVMNSHKGNLIFPEPGDVDLPKEFKNGAQLLLSFKIK
ncbi:MAG: sensor histidine kinase [Ignavibacteriales bacterium]|nr:sensor histidine kinase [Ignavibacteriales bacterium]